MDNVKLISILIACIIVSAVIYFASMKKQNVEKYTDVLLNTSQPSPIGGGRTTIVQPIGETLTEEQLRLQLQQQQLGSESTCSIV
ncbi:hypothetical protein CCP3SC1AL1_630005 [Gammaproteobacteria bacterium]